MFGVSQIQSQLSEHKQVVLKDYAGGSFALVLTELRRGTNQPQLIITEDETQAERLRDELNFFDDLAAIDILPTFSVTPYSGLSPQRKTLTKTLDILYRLSQRKLDVLLAPQEALFRRVLDKKYFDGLRIIMTKKDLLDRDELVHKLTDLGYERSTVVEEVGQYALRGDVLDVFSPQYALPHRVSFFDIEIEDIKSFDPVNQRTIDACVEIAIIPAHEIFLHHYQKITTAPSVVALNWKSDLKKRADENGVPKLKRDQIEDYVAHGIHFHGIEFFLPLFYNKLGSVFDYLLPQTLIVTPLQIPVDQTCDDFIRTRLNEHAETKNFARCVLPEEIFLSENNVKSLLPRFPVLSLNGPAFADPSFPDVPPLIGGTELNSSLFLAFRSEMTKIHSLAPLVSEINAQRLNGVTCRIVCSGVAQAERVRDLLTRFELPLSVVKDENRRDHLNKVFDGSDSHRLVYLITGELRTGFFSKDNKQWWLTDEDIFGQKTRRTDRKTPASVVFSSFADLTVGDFIVHQKIHVWIDAAQRF